MLTNSKKGDVLLALTLVLLVALTITLKFRNDNILDRSGELTQIKVLRIFTKDKGRLGKEKVADVEYMTSKGVIKDFIPYTEGIVEGQCYTLRYAKENVKIIKIETLVPVECKSN